MITLKQINEYNSLCKIPKSIHVNKNTLLDYRLFNALVKPDEKRDYKYDFDVYLQDYKINLQRPYVWEHYQQNDFILSILFEKPIDDIIVIKHVKDSLKRENEINYVIDGKQRLITIKKFANNEFPIIIGEKECFFKDMSEEAMKFFASRVNYLTATIYYSYEDNPVTDEMKIILFNFYNFAGTPQTNEHKNNLQKILNKIQ